MISEIADGNVDPSVMEKMLKSFLDELPSKAMGLGIKIVLCILLFFIGTKLIKMIQKMLTKSMQKAGAEEGVISFMASLTEKIS